MIFEIPSMKKNPFEMFGKKTITKEKILDVKAAMIEIVSSNFSILTRHNNAPIKLATIGKA
jgi:hypothetical protein